MPKFQVTVKLTAEATIIIEAPSKKAVKEFLNGGCDAANAIAESYGQIDEFSDVEGLEVEQVTEGEANIQLDKDGEIKED